MLSRLEWNNDNHTTSDVPGVQTRVPGFGGTESIECLDKFCAVPYMKSLVEFLVANGYERGKDLTAATYDFRYSPGKPSSVEGLLNLSRKMAN